MCQRSADLWVNEVLAQVLLYQITDSFCHLFTYPKALNAIPPPAYYLKE